MKRLVLCLSLLIAVSTAAPAVVGSAEDLKFTALWCGQSCSSGQRYAGIGVELKKLGVEVQGVATGQQFTESLLEGVDLVVIACRNEYLSSAEQQLLVRYVQEGGSLLAMYGIGADATAINPITANFGLIFSATASGSSKMNVLEHPATTARRPIKSCMLGMAVLLHLDSGAKSIGGRNFGTGPAAMHSFLGMATNCGKGRVIVFSDDEAWQTYG